MIPDSIKLHLSETMLMKIDQYPVLIVKNKFTAAASIFQRAIQANDFHFEQEIKVVLFDMIETEFLAYQNERWELKDYEKYLLDVYFKLD